MVSEIYPSASEIHIERRDVSQLKALSLNFLRSISEIPGDKEVPKLNPCCTCGKEIPAFSLQDFAHIFHRTYLEKHIIGAEIRFPTCPTCPHSLKLLERNFDLFLEKEGNASQQSNVTILGIGNYVKYGVTIIPIVDNFVSMQDQTTSLIINKYNNIL
ncbi:6157_t:CDS:2 [Acaulospora morrowiae]|uniref:6157_t:CDS:1 n=1 Tax=Acaulospora morrowiae TaxID=94023 RepID=A0A9N8ZSH3_9GLOM|nr:6157_t:CDS:2 [Acaulospora morrowiae]